MNSSICVFVGAKGGAGTTTVCYEIGKALLEKSNVALVDADLSGHRSLALLTEAMRALDAARSTSPIATARVDGMTVVELADRYDAGLTLAPEAVEALADSLQGFGAILVDAPQPFAAAVRPLLTRAARVFLVVEPTLLGIAGGQAMSSDLRRFGVPAERIGIVTNVRSDGDAPSRGEIERLLGARPVAEIPPLKDRAYGKSIAAFARMIQFLPPEAPLARLQPSSSPAATNGNGKVGFAARSHEVESQYQAAKLEIHEALLRRVDLVTAATAHTDSAKFAELRTKIEAITSEYIAEHDIGGSAEDVAQLRQEIVNEALGLGPLEDLMRDPDRDRSDGERAARHLRRTRGRHRAHRPSDLRDDRQLRLIIERIVAPLGRRIDESSPMVDARLAGRLARQRDHRAARD